MSRKVLIPLFAAVFFAAPVLTATAATTVKGTKSNASEKVGGGKPKATRATTVHGSKSNADNKVGSGKPRGAARATTVKGTKSNSGYRMGGGGGGKGAMRRDTEPPRGGGPGIVQKGRR
jgi:hypothetical protein